MDVDEIDLVDRLRTTLHVKGDQIDALDPMPTVSPQSGEHRSRARFAAMVGVAAVLLLAVVLVRRGSEHDDVGTAESVAITADAPLPDWLPAGMDVWEVGTAEVRQTSTVVLQETGSDRRIEILVHDSERADEVDLSGVIPSGNTLGTWWPDIYTIGWGESDRLLTAIGHGLEPPEIAAVVRQITLHPEGDGYAPSTLPDGWTLAETRVEPAALSTRARFAVDPPDPESPNLLVTETVGDGPGDGAGWTSAGAYLPADADGSIWTLPGDTETSSSVTVVNRRGRSVTLVSTGAERLGSEQLQELARRIVDGPSDQLTSLSARAEANIAATPVVASATTPDGETLEVHGSADGGAVAICTTSGSAVDCPPYGFGTRDVLTVTSSEAGQPVVLGASRQEPSFDEAELRSTPWVTQDGDWWVFRLEPTLPAVMVGLEDGSGLQVMVPANR